jgi:hypothetical protein
VPLFNYGVSVASLWLCEMRVLGVGMRESWDGGDCGEIVERLWRDS